LTIALIVGLLLIAVAVTLVVRALTVPRVRTVEALSQIPSYGYAGVAETEGSEARNALDEIAGALGATVGRYISSMREDALRKQLIAAGLYRVPPRRFVGYQLLAAFTLALGLVWLTAIAGASGAAIFFFGFFGLVLGWVGPRFIIGRRARTRFEQIEYDLPELIDLLVVSIESGLGLTGSLRVATERMEGPLVDEFSLVLHEMRIGQSRSAALKNLSERVDAPEVSQFARAIIQADQLGIALSRILRVQSQDMRVRRQLAAEEKAMKAPVKMLFPTVIFIFPSMFVVALGPAALNLMKTFAGG